MGPFIGAGEVKGTTAAVVLAAGGGTRFRGPTHKLLAPWHGSTVIEHAVAHAFEAGFDETIVVSGSVDLPRFDPAVTVVHNAAWVNGQATSLQVAVSHARACGHRAIVIGLGDQPMLSVRAWRSVGAAVDTPISVATYDGRRGQPVRLDQEIWHLLPDSGDEGARSLLVGNPMLVTEVACTGSPIDIDTAEDLHRWS